MKKASLYFLLLLLLAKGGGGRSQMLRDWHLLLLLLLSLSRSVRGESTQLEFSPPIGGGKIGHSFFRRRDPIYAMARPKVIESAKLAIQISSSPRNSS